LSLGASKSLPFQIISMVLAVAGLAIAIVARTTLADNWSATIDVKQGHELITRGIYHYIRNPIYSGMLLMILATILAFPSRGGLAILLVAAAIFWFRIKTEEALMTKTFPDEYPAYKRRTKALIPFIL
jgi:protein-S-isoprenylcysteine O-methyltransferase